MLDKVVALPSAVDEVLEKELANSGLFRSVAIAKPDAPVPTDCIVVETSLLGMNWNIPGHDKLVATGFVLGLTTGIVGGGIYGSTKTDIESSAHLRFKVSESNGGRVLLEKEYEAKATDRVTKFACDTPKTGRRISGDALKQVMDAFKADLSTLLRK